MLYQGGRTANQLCCDLALVKAICRPILINRTLFALSDGVWQVRECNADFLMASLEFSEDEQEFFLSLGLALTSRLVHHSRQVDQLPHIGACLCLRRQFVTKRTGSSRPFSSLVTADALQSRRYAFRGSAPETRARLPDSAELS